MKYIEIFSALTLIIQFSGVLFEKKDHHYVLEPVKQLVEWKLLRKNVSIPAADLIYFVYKMIEFKEREILKMKKRAAVLDFIEAQKQKVLKFCEDADIENWSEGELSQILIHIDADQCNHLEAENIPHVIEVTKIQNNINFILDV